MKIGDVPTFLLTKSSAGVCRLKYASWDIACVEEPKEPNNSDGTDRTKEGGPHLEAPKP